MKLVTRLSSALVAGVAMLSFSHAAWSLGLGTAKVDSFLDQPLSVKIELITQQGDDLNAITAGLASAEDYQLIGASRDDISAPLTFTINGARNPSFISVTSSIPITDPVVRLIVEVNWAKGRMLREYTLFLDPATFSQPAPAARPSSPVTSTAGKPGVTEPNAAAEAAGSSARVTGNADSDRVSRVPGAGEYGPVQSGDTLWRIAQNWSAGTDLNVNRVMLAIQRANPTAFARNNINLLQRGAILRMPEIDQIQSISISMANDEVRNQAAALNSRQANMKSDTPLLVDENVAPVPAEPSQPGAPAEQTSAPEPDSLITEDDTGQQPVQTVSEPESQLELVPPSRDSATEGSFGTEETLDAAEGSEPVEALREELARTEEELINQQQQNSYLEQRLSELEKQLAENQAGTVEDQSLSNMEQRLRDERLANNQEAPGTPPGSTNPEGGAASAGNEPWYSGFMMWGLGLLILVALIAGWIMSRRGGSEVVAPVGADAALRGIKQEAEDVLRVLDSKSKTARPVEAAITPEDGDKTVIAPAAERTVETRKKSAPADYEAEVLDEESADPEIQLDLARAYISMGDKEAARVILEEVIANGSDQQLAEATKMKSFL